MTRNFTLPRILDSLHDSSLKAEETDFLESYLGEAKRKEQIHENVKKRVDIKPSQIKTCYD